MTKLLNSNTCALTRNPYGSRCPTRAEPVSSEIDRHFAEYRRRAVPAAALDHEGEDTTMPELLGAALTAWIAERDGDQSYMCDPPPGRHVVLHARLRESLDRATEDERHWAFVPSLQPMPSPHRIESRRRGAQQDSGWARTGGSCSYCETRSGPPARRPLNWWMTSTAPGGRTVAISDDDIRTMTALRDLIGEDPAELASWLRARRPAHGLTILREALGDNGFASDVAAPQPQPEPEPHVTEAAPMNPTSRTTCPRTRYRWGPTSEAAQPFRSTLPPCGSMSQSSPAPDRARRS